MRFSSTGDHVRYTVIPKDYELQGNHKKILPGSLAAEFFQHEFDSEKAQKSNRWTDEQRVQVEDYLKDHPDFGFQIWEVDELVAGINFSGQRCLFSVPTEGGVIDVCGEPAIEDSLYCAKHDADVSKAPTKPNRRKDEMQDQEA